MGTKIKWETAENMMNIIAFTVCQSFIENDEEIDLEAIQDFVRSTFEEYCKVMGITEVEEPEDDDYDEDDENEEEDMESIIYDCDGHRGISADDARLLMQCVTKVMKKEFSYLPEEVVEVLIQNETLRIASEWNIEVVDTGNE